jgi:hypothetical protein
MQPEAPGVPGGPEAVNTAEPLGLEVVVALELLAQPPELPVTPDWIFTLCVLDVLLHVYAFAIDVGATKTAKIPAIEIAINKVSFLVIHVII